MSSRLRFLLFALVGILLLISSMAGCSAWREALGSPTPVASRPGSLPTIAFAFTPLSMTTATLELTSTLTIELGTSTVIRVSPTLLPSETVTPTATQDPAACVPARTQVDYGLVKWVAGGDTIIVDIRGRLYSVRYLGVQAPAGTTDPANRHTDMVLNRVVRLVRDVSDVDRFGQLLRYVFADDIFINYELISQGLASAIETPPNQACAETFLQAETQARSQELGIWAEVAMLLPTSTWIPFTPTSLPSLTPTGLLQTGTPTSTQPSSTVSPQATFTQSESQPTSTATLNLGQPTATYLPTPTGEYFPDLRISNIFYQGRIAGAESDEYVEITNAEGFPVNLQGWLLGTGTTGLELELTNFTLLPGQSCRVYTNMMRPESCGISFRSAEPLWDNEEDCGFLSEPLNFELVDFFCYPPE